MIQTNTLFSPLKMPHFQFGKKANAQADAPAILGGDSRRLLFSASPPTQDTLSIRFGGTQVPPTAGTPKSDGAQGVSAAEDDKSPPKFTTESVVVLENLKDFNIPRKSNENWPIAVMQFLCSDDSVKKYLEDQKIDWNGIFLGLRQVLLPELQKTSLVKEPINDAMYRKIASDLQAFTTKEGGKKVTPVHIWRWLMLEDPTKNIETILTLSGLKDEMVKRIRSAPAPKMKKVGVSPRPTKEEIMALDKALKEVPEIVIGQASATRKVLTDLKTTILGYNIEKNPHKPKAVILLLGPSGVGKTFMAEEISRIMGRGKPIYVPMNEYKDGQNVSKLTGAAPGYTGYGDGGSFADSMLKANDKTAKDGSPAPFVLFDEIEKANPAVFDVIMQIFDKGEITTGKGQVGTFDDSYIIMTSNIAQREIAAAKAEGKTEDEIQDIVRKELEKQFKPEFIGRLNSVAIFDTLSKESVGIIMDKEIDKLAKNAKDADGYDLVVKPEVRSYMLNKGFSEKTGAREVKNVLRTVLHASMVTKREELIMQDKLAPAGKMIASLVMEPNGVHGKVVLEYQPDFTAPK
ncbi:MAG: AAA family ATPase, partial [Cyanobacteria bacterium]|nr:AAA family ATPase [Cyanobacteriota bacterium]